MREVLAALIPAIALSCWYFGPGVLVQLLLACASAALTEALATALRGRPIAHVLGDNSALVCGALLALCMPPLAPWWLVVGATVFALVVAKHLYGGLGANLFNPAMVGYAAALVSFPEHMTQWPLPGSAGLDVSLGAIFGDLTIDGLTGATVLDQARSIVHAGHSLSGFEAFGQVAGTAERAVVAAGFLAGGAWMLWRGIVRWHIPATMLGALAALSLGFHFADPARYAAFSVHLLGGATLFGAFFIATDPVTAPGTALGRMLFGAGVGALVFVIRTFGAYPDAVAFAVLVMNMCTPAIDYFLRPRAHDDA